MNWTRFALAFAVACAVVLLGAAVVAGSGGGPAPDAAQNDTNDTAPSGHVANATAYQNATCVPGLVGDGTGCLDNDQVTPT